MRDRAFVFVPLGCFFFPLDRQLGVVRPPNLIRLTLADEFAISRLRAAVLCALSFSSGVSDGVVIAGSGGCVGSLDHLVGAGE